MMIFERRLLWALLPYAAVMLGMFFRSAWGALLGFHAALLIVLLRPQARKHASRLLAPAPMRVILPLACMGLLGGLGLWLVWPFAGLDGVYAQTVYSLGLKDSAWLLFIAYFTLVNPWLEEWFWRGFLADTSRGPSGVDAAFGGYHLFILVLFVSPGWMMTAFIVLLVTAWVWRRASQKDRSLLPAVIAHMLADFSILLVLVVKAGIT